MKLYQKTIIIYPEVWLGSLNLAHDLTNLTTGLIFYNPQYLLVDYKKSTPMPTNRIFAHIFKK